MENNHLKSDRRSHTPASIDPPKTEGERRRILAQALHDTAADLNSAKNVEEFFASLVTQIGKSVPQGAVQLFLVDPDGIASLDRNTGALEKEKGGIETSRPWKLPVATTPILSIMDSSGVPCLVDNLDDSPWVKDSTSTWAKSLLGTPVRVRGVTKGFLVLLSDARGSFTPEHRILLQTFAYLAAVAIEKANLNEQLNQLATMDSLTGIPNRRHFFNLVEAEIIRSTRYNHPLSALLMDIDHFKQLNDTFGHTIGDRVLVEVANRCEVGLRASDLRCRYGGEEFAFVLPETDLDAAGKVAERLRNLISSKPISTSSEEIRVTVSIGVTSFSHNISSARALLDLADQALYRAKQTGRNRVVKGE